MTADKVAGSVKNGKKFYDVSECFPIGMIFLKRVVMKYFVFRTISAYIFIKGFWASGEILPGIGTTNYVIILFGIEKINY